MVQLKLSLLGGLLFLSTFGSCENAYHRTQRLLKQYEAVKKAPAWPFQGGGPTPPASAPHTKPSAPWIRKPDPKSRYATPQAQKFKVDGANIPDLDFDIGESYAGLLPISNSTKEEKELFFWFFPSSAPQATDEIAVWFNGGPGCSSLVGFLSENGPFLWQAGRLKPWINTYSWHRVTNFVWIEQPVGVGYTLGQPDITTEEQLAEEFKGFWKNFVATFGLQKDKIYLTGESYAGAYIPYISKAFLDTNDTVNFNLKGVSLIDPIIGTDDLQQCGTAVPFAKKWQPILNLNDSTWDGLNKAYETCGWQDYWNKYYQFPPPKQPWGPKPLIDASNFCCPWDAVYSAAFYTNPCFSVYRITQTCPIADDELSPDEPNLLAYFDRSDVKKALNVNPTYSWSECSESSVFLGGDASPHPALTGTLSSVINRLNNTLIGVGALDFILPIEGTLFTLQNVTWGGKQGFQKKPDSNVFFVPQHIEAQTNDTDATGVGSVGKWGEERGLTFYTVQQAGHMLPGHHKAAGYRSVQRLLGRIHDLSSTDPVFGTP